MSGLVCPCAVHRFVHYVVGLGLLAGWVRGWTVRAYGTMFGSVGVKCCNDLLLRLGAPVVPG
ncbi:hypothetical protein GCM10009720_09460 [Yaniella flava]|uniref:Uncharacterized protein n=1 Tax=Yaniella flava TaxID=287930 RepID=A0ABP5FSR7_9MICC